MTKQYPESSVIVAGYLLKKAKDMGCPRQEFATIVHMAYVSKLVSEDIRLCKTCSENAEVTGRLEFLCSLSLEMLSGVVNKSPEETDRIFIEMFPEMKEMYGD